MHKNGMIIGIAGSGTMGVGIAQVAAMMGFRVVLCTRRSAALEEAVSIMAVSLAKLHEKEIITEEPATILSRVTTSCDLTSLSACSLVVEAIAEQMEAKCQLLEKLGTLVGGSAILATTTSSLSVTALGQASGIPGRFIGMHFMNPVPLMEVVELIAGEQTLAETVLVAQELTVALGKTYVNSKDCPGFIITRLLGVMFNEAFEMLRNGVACAEEIDTAMKLGANHPMGPLALADMVGLDVVLAAIGTLATGIDNHKYAPSPLLQEYVAKGHLGRKSGQGVYNYH